MSVQNAHLMDSGLALTTARAPIYSFHRTSREVPLTFDQAAAVVRLAHKYDLPDVSDQALALLEEHAFPPDSPRAPQPLPNPTLIVHDINAIGAVNLARLVDRPALLISALHRCTALGSAVLDGWTREDGQVEHLAPGDLKLCMDAHVPLQRARVTLFVECAYNENPHRHCATPGKCAIALRAVQDAMFREEFRQPRATLDAWETPVGERADACGACRCCREMVEGCDASARGDAWVGLPETFGIEVAGWGES